MELGAASACARAARTEAVPRTSWPLAEITIIPVATPTRSLSSASRPTRDRPDFSIKASAARTDRSAECSDCRG